MSVFETKDSGARAEYDSGMVRDIEEGKPRFDLLLPSGVPFAEQMLTRDAMLMERGRKKYGARNWEKANGEAELARYHSSALRHLHQWIAGETDEDHAAAVRFNVMAGEFVKRRLAAPQVERTLGPVPSDTQFLCGHMYGEEPRLWDDDHPCGTAVHWSRVNGVELKAGPSEEANCNCETDWPEHGFECPLFNVARP